MKNKTFDTIGYILSLITSEEFESSIQSLHEEIFPSLSIQTIRNSLLKLCKNKLLNTLLSLKDSSNDELYIKIDDQVKKQIKNGMHDDKIICLTAFETFIPNNFLLPVTYSETEYLKKEYPDLIPDKDKKINSFEIKYAGNAVPYNNSLVKIQAAIQTAIIEQKVIEFHYLPSKASHREFITCSPVFITQNLTDHLTYFKDSEGNNYRIDRIDPKKVKQKTEKANLSSYKENPNQKYFWSINSKNSESPIHVKLRISKNTTNIIEKIKNDTRLRQKTSHLYEDENFYYYEDDIIGVQDFRRWLRNYGSSITVLEPQSIIHEIVTGAKNTLDYYDKL